MKSIKYFFSLISKFKIYLQLLSEHVVSLNLLFLFILHIFNCYKADSLKIILVSDCSSSLINTYNKTRVFLIFIHYLHIFIHYLHIFMHYLHIFIHYLHIFIHYLHIFFNSSFYLSNSLSIYPSIHLSVSIIFRFISIYCLL